MATPNKKIAYRDAVKAMRDGQTLARMHLQGGGKGWFLVPPAAP